MSDGRGGTATQSFTVAVTKDTEAPQLDMSLSANPADLGTFVTVTLSDGRTVERMRYYASGTPQAPLTKEQVEEKFFSCAERAVDKIAAAKIFAFLNRIEQERSFSELWSLARRA